MANSMQTLTNNNLDRREFIKLMGLSAASLPLLSLLGCENDPKQAVGAGKPNIILTLADDVGLSNIGCYGGQFATPNLDDLAKTGVQFDYCYATPLCAPSRTQLLTGRYPFRTGVIDNDRRGIRPNHEIMIPTVMKSAGYVTACIGKWGQLPLGPGDWGFDEYLSFQGNGRYWRRPDASWGKSYVQNGEKINLPEGKYLPDIMHDFLVGFLERHINDPLFIYYSLSHVHTPIVETPDTIAGLGTGNLYADNVVYMDKLMGKLVDELDRLKLRDNTLLVFTGDNGMLGAGTINGRKIDGGKRSMHDGGCRVPFIANWPKGAPAGTINHNLTDFSDFLPTFAELGGASLPEGVIIDGQSEAKQIQGKYGPRREWVYAECRGSSFARDYKYKLTNEGKLFDMRDAPFTEIPVPGNTTDSEAIASRAFLQTVLNQHPTLHL